MRRTFDILGATLGIHTFFTVFGTGNPGRILGSGDEKQHEPLKIAWLIDCYRGLYYLVYWGLCQPIVGKPINQLV